MGIDASVLPQIGRTPFGPDASNDEEFGSTNLTLKDIFFGPTSSIPSDGSRKTASCTFTIRWNEKGRTFPSKADADSMRRTLVGVYT